MLSATSCDVAFISPWQNRILIGKRVIYWFPKRLCKILTVPAFDYPHVFGLFYSCHKNCELSELLVWRRLDPSGKLRCNIAWLSNLPHLIYHFPLTFVYLLPFFSFSYLYVMVVLLESVTSTCTGSRSSYLDLRTRLVCTGRFRWTQKILRWWCRPAKYNLNLFIIIKS